MKKGILNWSDLSNENPDHVAAVDAKRKRACRKDTSSHSNILDPKPQRKRGSKKLDRKRKSSVGFACEQNACSKFYQDKTAFLMQIKFDPKEKKTETIASADSMGLPTCKIPNDESNTTIPMYQEWVTETLRQKFDKFS